MSRDLRERLDRELAHVAADPAALAVIRRRTRLGVTTGRRPARRWLVIGIPVTAAAAAAVVAIAVAGGQGTPATLSPIRVAVTPGPDAAPTPSTREPTASRSSASGPAPTPTAPGTRGAQLRASLVSGTYVAADGTRFPALLPTFAGGRAGAASTAGAGVTAVCSRLTTPLVPGRRTGAVGAQILFTSSQVISLRLTSDATSAEAAHPDDEVATLVVRRDTGSVVSPSTYFTSQSAALKALAAYAKQELDARLGANHLYPGPIAATAANFGNLSPVTQGLRIDFPYYSVGPRPVNDPVVVVPWSLVDALLTPGTAALFGQP